MDQVPEGLCEASGVQYGRNIVASVDKNSKRMQEKDRQVEVSPLLLTSGVVKLWEVLLQEVC
jgi:hypothetical protein